MFKLTYKIVENDYDDFKGEGGFFLINCNGYLYGEMYSDEIAKFICTDEIFDWLERLVRVVENLEHRNYVVLSDTESYSTWLEFKKQSHNLTVSILHSDAFNATSDIEYELIDYELGDWGNQTVLYEQFKSEILNTTKEYLEEIKIRNNTDKYSYELEDRVNQLLPLNL